MRDSVSNRRIVRVPAGVGEFRDVTLGGRVMFVQSATAPFSYQFDDNEVGIIKGGAMVRYPSGFRRIRVFNASAVYDLIVVIYTGTADVEFLELAEPQVRNVGWNVNLAIAAEFTFPGFARFSDTTADGVTRKTNYLLHNVEEGARRKLFAVSMRGGDQTGKILVWNADTNALLMLVPAGQSRAWHGDENLRLQNKTAAALSSTDSGGDAPDVSIMETFYA